MVKMTTVAGFEQADGYFSRAGGDYGVNKKSSNNESR